MKRKREAARPGAESREGKPGTDTDSSWLPGWAPYTLFALLTLFLFREFVISNGMLFGTDVLALGYFARHLYAEMVRGAHIFPLWNPFIFGGIPFVDAMHGDIFYPTTALKFVMPVHRAMGWKLVLHVFLAGTFTYGWVRHLKVDRSIAAFAGVTYMLAPVLVSLIYPGHDGKLFVTALSPLALWTTDWAIVRGDLWRFACLSLVVALLIFTAHMQLAYFATWAVAVLAVFRLVQLRRGGARTSLLINRFVGFALAGFVGALLIAAVQIWTPLSYLTRYSQRVEKTTGAEAETGYAYSASWSLHLEEAVSLAVPEFIGYNPQMGEGPATYWGRNPFKLNHEYSGLIPLLLLPLAFLNRRRRGEAWLFTGIAAASLVYALGATTPLFRLYYWLVPGVKLFRAPSSIMFIFAIAAISAAALGLEGLRRAEDRDEYEKIAKKVSVYLWSVGGVFLLLALLTASGALTDLWTELFYRDIAPAKVAALQSNLPGIQRGFWLSFLLTALLAGGWQLRARGVLKQPAWIGVVILLSALDLLRVSPQFVRVINPTLIYPKDETTEFLLKQRQGADPFRVFSPTGVYQTNHFAFHGLEELTGHHGNELGRYLDMVDFQRLGAQGFRTLKLLNARYLVSAAPLEAPGLREVFRGRRSIVYELQGVYPRAFLVSRSQYALASGSAALDRLVSPDFDPAQQLLLDEAPGAETAVERHAGGAVGQVRWVERGINHHELEVEANAPAFLVISDNYYPAWRALVDGEAAAVLRADYTLRAVPVPEGKHRVRLYYRSTLFNAAVWTSLLSAALVVSFTVIAVARTPRGRSAERSEPRP